MLTIVVNNLTDVQIVPLWPLGTFSVGSCIFFVGLSFLRFLPILFYKMFQVHLECFLPQSWSQTLPEKTLVPFHVR